MSSLGRSLLRNKSLLKLGAQETPQEIVVSFHSSGLTCNQWRKLKNLWAPGRTLFRPSCFGTKEDKFLNQYAQSGGPTCLAFFPKEASDKLESIDQDLLLLYGQYGSTLVDHMDIQKGAALADSETSLFDFCLPSSYLSFMCSKQESDDSKVESDDSKVESDDSKVESDDSKVESDDSKVESPPAE